jgi:hypothetical protein
MGDQFQEVIWQEIPEIEISEASKVFKNPIFGRNSPYLLVNSVTPSDE